MTLGPDQRYYGADSIMQSSKIPKTTFTNILDLLGEPMIEEQIEEFKKHNFIFSDIQLDERGLPGFFIGEKDDQKEILYTEEVLGMIFAHGKFLADKQSNSRINDCVVTIPSYFDLNKRRMIEDAAELAGLSVMQMIHENTAAAVMYGLHRKDYNETHTVLFYNMGGRDTEVSIVRYGSVTDDKKKQYEHIEILAEASEPHLGSTNVDKVILNELASRFDAMPERKGKDSVLTDRRAVNRLMKDSIKTKEILSANKDATVKVPELLDYVTLNTKLERSELEAQLEEDFKIVGRPIEQALTMAGLTVEDIDQVELIGGGIRVPKVQEALQASLPGKELGQHLNGDEAMCFGSAYIASNSSESFKVKKIFLTQKIPETLTMRISKADPEFKENEDVTYNKVAKLFKKGDILGLKKSLSLTYDTDMNIEIFRGEQTDEDPELENL